MVYYFLAGKAFDLPAIKFIGATGSGGSVWESRAFLGEFMQDVCPSGKRPACLPRPQFYRRNLALAARAEPSPSRDRLPELDFLENSQGTASVESASHQLYWPSKKNPLQSPWKWEFRNIVLTGRWSYYKAWFITRAPSAGSSSSPVRDSSSAFTIAGGTGTRRRGEPPVGEGSVYHRQGRNAPVGPIQVFPPRITVAVIPHKSGEPCFEQGLPCRLAPLPARSPPAGISNNP